MECSYWWVVIYFHLFRSSCVSSHELLCLFTQILHPFCKILLRPFLVSCSCLSQSLSLSLGRGRSHPVYQQGEKQVQAQTWGLMSQPALHLQATSHLLVSSWCCSVAQLCPTLWPLDCRTPGFPVLHHLLGLAQTDVHWVKNSCFYLPNQFKSIYSLPYNLLSKQQLVEHLNLRNDISQPQRLQCLEIPSKNSQAPMLGLPSGRFPSQAWLLSGHSWPLCLSLGFFAHRLHPPLGGHSAGSLGSARPAWWGTPCQVTCASCVTLDKFRSLSGPSFPYL